MIAYSSLPSPSSEFDCAVGVIEIIDRFLFSLELEIDLIGDCLDVFLFGENALGDEQAHEAGLIALRGVKAHSKMFRIRAHRAPLDLERDAGLNAVQRIGIRKFLSHKILYPPLSV